LIVTTAGTGFAPREYAEADRARIETEVPELRSERADTFQINPKALLSRGVCGNSQRKFDDQSAGLSTKGLQECFEVIQRSGRRANSLREKSETLREKKGAKRVNYR